VKVDIGDGVHLWFDVEGLGLVPDGDTMVARPTLLLLHGGPGMDHASFKPAFSVLADMGQIVYLDHRGQGRSDRRTPDEWYLDVWADDVARFCDALAIERPIVLGNSFGGMVAMRFGIRHPDRARALVLSSTSADLDIEGIVGWFARLGGAEAAAVARTFWNDPSPANRPEYVRVCGPLYTQTPGNIFGNNRAVRNDDVGPHFFLGEERERNDLPLLDRIAVPTLLLAGTLDPVCPIEGMEAIHAAIRPDLARFERFEGCGHGVFRDDPDRAFAVLRDFIATVG
jgi:pimeloyl-ACP methyl ester carboxylesterase